MYLLGCPKCGAQRQAKGEWIGRTEVCDCGQAYRFTLVLAKMPPEPDGVFAQMFMHLRRLWKCILKFWQQEILPCLQRMLIYIREQIIPQIALAIKTAYTWTSTAIQSAFKPNPPSSPKTTTFTADDVVATVTDIPTSEESNEKLVRHEVRTNPVSPTSYQRFEELFTEPSVSNGNSTADDCAPVPQWKVFRQLAQQMLKAGVFADSYSFASKAIELEPTATFCWATKGLAAAYLSQPPDFRLNELTFCINKAIESPEVAEATPSIQEHIFTAVERYRKLIAEAATQAKDDSQKEPLANDVNIGLQLTLRNQRVDRIHNEKQAPGFMSTVDAIMFARNLAPSLVISKKALTNMDSSLWNSTIASFKDSDGLANGRQRILIYRQKLVADIKKDDPTFQAPEAPEPSGCFIATAAAGGENHPHVVRLREFRDSVLLQFSVGQSLIRLYYRFGPAAARIISDRKGLQHLVYVCLVVPAAFGARTILRLITMMQRKRGH